MGMDSFSGANRKFTGRVGDENGSKEMLTLGKKSISVGSAGTFGDRKQGNHKTVELVATSESSRSTPTSMGEDAFQSRGGFY
jgi:hypothetical protein